MKAIPQIQTNSNEVNQLQSNVIPPLNILISQLSANSSVISGNQTLDSKSPISVVSAKSQAIVLTIPEASSDSSSTFRIIKTDDSFNPVTIRTTNFSTTLDTQGETVTLVPSGNTYVVLERYIPSVWTSYPAVINLNGGVKGTVIRDLSWWRRVGDSIEVRYDYAQSAGGSTGSTYGLGIPSPLVMSTTKIPNTSAQSVILGSCQAESSSVPAFYWGSVIWTSPSTVAFTLDNDAATNKSVIFGSNPLGLGQTTLNLSAIFTAPITGWNG